MLLILSASCWCILTGLTDWADWLTGLVRYGLVRYASGSMCGFCSADFGRTVTNMDVEYQ